MSKSVAELARKLLLKSYHGVLSTHSVDTPGYPFGSVVPYCLDKSGQPIILISRIAQHTKNIAQNNKASLIVTENGVDDVQAAARLTYLGDVEVIDNPDEDIAMRYYRYFPDALDFHKIHDFDFYRITLKRGRFIGGFGKIHWVDNDHFLKSNPFSTNEELDMVEHMNKDHADAMVKYCQFAGIFVADDEQPVMVGIDGEGFHLRLGARVVRFDFDEEVNEPLQVREALVEMVKRGDGE